MNAPGKIEAAKLYSAMAAAFAEIEGATKLNIGQVGQQKYKYADLTSVIEAIKPALVKNGLFFIQKPEPCERGVTIETIVGHSGGEAMSLGSLFVPANKNDAQGYGSALTYARRYALVTAFGVPVEDDDGNAAVRSQEGQSHAGAVSPPAAKREPRHSALKTSLRAFVHELNGCGDGDELSAFLATADSVKLVAEVKDKVPHWWDGEDWPDGEERPPEFVPLADRINQRMDECAHRTVGQFHT